MDAISQIYADPVHCHLVSSAALSVADLYSYFLLLFQKDCLWRMGFLRKDIAQSEIADLPRP